MLPLYRCIFLLQAVDPIVDFLELAHLGLLPELLLKLEVLPFLLLLDVVLEALLVSVLLGCQPHWRLIALLGL